jgi:hypothetical protein
MDDYTRYRIEKILKELSTTSNKAIAFQYEGDNLDNIVGVAYFNKNIQNYHYISYN